MTIFAWLRSPQPRFDDTAKGAIDREATVIFDESRFLEFRPPLTEFRLNKQLGLPFGELHTRGPIQRRARRTDALRAAMTAIMPLVTAISTIAAPR